MSVDYIFEMCVGFELDEKEVFAPLLKTKKEEGVFHLEDRFNPKTGEKLKQEKVWDVKPQTKTWLEYNGKIADDCDPEETIKFLVDIFECRVEEINLYKRGYKFVVNKNDNSPFDEGHTSIYNMSMNFNDVCALSNALTTLKNKMIAVGYKVDEPKVFISCFIC